MNSIFNKKTKEESTTYDTMQVYHIQNGIANITLYLLQNIGEKFFMGRKD